MCRKVYQLFRISKINVALLVKHVQSQDMSLKLPVFFLAAGDDHRDILEQAKAKRSCDEQSIIVAFMLLMGELEADRGRQMIRI